MTEESNEGGVDAREDVLDGMYSSMYIEQSSIGTDKGTSKTAELESNTVDLGFSACLVFLADFLLAGSISPIVSSVTMHGSKFSIIVDEAIAEPLSKDPTEPSSISLIMVRERIGSFVNKDLKFFFFLC